jgi:hypothetical protein
VGFHFSANMSLINHLQGFCYWYLSSSALRSDVQFLIAFSSTALGYLYSAVSLNLVRPENARGVLAAACLLGGMDDLCRYAYEACRQSLTVGTINEWLEFIDMVPLHSLSNGTASPDRPGLTTTSVYGFYAQRLRDDVFEFLVVTLPVLLNVHQAPTNGAVSPSTESAPSRGRETLLQIFSRVPFDLFKAAIESPTFQIGTAHLVSRRPCMFIVSC